MKLIFIWRVEYTKLHWVGIEENNSQQNGCNFYPIHSIDYHIWSQPNWYIPAGFKSACDKLERLYCDKPKLE